ncbi:TonB-dependent receptor [Hyphomonas sp.]|uniref:TonB-dependent receptor n=1 Tax=Hyphomonas sp. TaxID=87 RepID=UPI0035635EE9
MQINALLLSTGMASVAMFGQAVAQTDDSDAQNEVRTLNRVVVTAQKREQSLQDVPISMEVISGDTLADLQITDFQALTKLTPNVSVQLTAGNNVIYIRGFGSPPANFSFDQAVSMYIDGVYAGKARQAQAPFFDIERVEVLRGPQGALFGKNTAAGAVSVVTAGPTEEVEGAATAIYNFDLEGTEIYGHVAGPITDDLSARLALRFVDQDGYILNEANGRKEPQVEQALARLTLKYAPDGPFDYTVKVDYGDNRRTGGMNVSGSTTEEQDPDLTRYSTYSTIGEEGTEATSWMVSGTGNLELGDYTLTSVTGYSMFRSDINNYFDLQNPVGGVTFPSVFNSYPEHFRQMSQELRLLSPIGEKFEYIVGAYYDTSRYQLSQFTGFFIPAFAYNGLERSDFAQWSQSYSIFGQGTYHFSDTIRAIGSLRYTKTEKRAGFDGELIYGPYPLRPLTVANGSIDEDNVDPSITMQWDVTPDLMTYATYGKGSKSGGFVGNTYGTIDSTFTYEPEKSENIEFGIKSTLQDGTIVLNGAIYETKFEDLQTSVYNSTISTYVTGNAATAKSTGVEASMSWFVTPDFDLSVSAAYQDAKYEDYPGASCLASQPISECNPADPATVAANNIGGTPLPYTSDFSGNFRAHYHVDFGNNLNLENMLSVSGRTEYFNSDNQNPVYGYQPAYTKIDLRVELTPDDAKWHIALVGKNLTDQITTGSTFKLPTPITEVSRAIFYIEEPRTISLEAGVKF